MKSIKILTGLLISIMLIGLVSAFSWPLPIGGKLTGENIANQLVETKNLRTGEVMSYSTSSSGEYMIDQINAKLGFLPGDTFEIKVVVCSAISSACVKQVKYNGEVRLTVNFDLGTTIPTPSCPPCICGSCGGSSGGVIYKCTQEEAEDMITCPEGKVEYKYLPCDDKTCADVKCEEKICEECKACEECKDCPEDKSILAYLLGAIGIMVGSAGTYYFKRKDAKLPNGTFVKFGGKGPRHYHRGIRSYHSPEIEHKEKHERHPKNELDPKYEKDIDGIYKYVGD